MGVKGLKKITIFWQTTNSNHSYKFFLFIQFQFY